MAAEELAEFTYFGEDVAAQDIPEQNRDDENELYTAGDVTSFQEESAQDISEKNQDDEDELYTAGTGVFKAMQGEQLEGKVAPDELNYSTWEDDSPRTEEAIRAGMAVLDSGATKTMGSIHAVERLLSWNCEDRGEHGMEGGLPRKADVRLWEFRPLPSYVHLLCERTVQPTPYEDEDPRDSGRPGPDPLVD